MANELLENYYRFSRQHGWHINYRDPQYGKSDIVDGTALSWLNEHPKRPPCMSVDWYFPVDPMQILPALVEAYNRLGNPGRFQLHALNCDSFDVVWNGVHLCPPCPAPQKADGQVKDLAPPGACDSERPQS